MSIIPDCCPNPKVLLRYFLAINFNPIEAHFGFSVVRCSPTVHCEIVNGGGKSLPLTLLGLNIIRWLVTPIVDEAKIYGPFTCHSDT